MSDLVEIELQEDGRRPEVERVRLEPGETFRLAFSPAQPPLRRFLLRGGDRQLADPDELPFLWLRAPDAARPWLRVTQVDTDVVDVPRIRTADKLLVAVEQDRKLGGRSTLVVKPPGERSFDLELRVAGRRLVSFATGGGQGPAGGEEEGEPPEELETEAPELDWEVPGAWESYGKPLVQRYQALRERIFQKLRPPPGLGRGLVVAASMLALVGFSFYSGRRASSARAEAAQARTDQENADESALASAEDAGACREELAELQRGQMNPEAARRNLVLSALAPPLARAEFIAGVSQTSERDEALAVSERARPDLVELVRARVAELQLAPPLQAWATARLELARTVHGDLPEHTLLWHPRFETLPEGQELYWSRGGTSLRGPFALGERPLRMVGGFEGSIDDAGSERGDPRPQQDWSVRTYTESLQAMRSALLAWSESAAGGRGKRMAVPPDELHLWSLALFSAWNEMPMEEDSGDIGQCARLVLDTLSTQRSAEPGEAVLPPILDVIETDEWVLPVGRTSACPWRDADLLDGVRSAMASVSVQVVLGEAPE